VDGAVVSMNEVVRTEGCVKIYTKEAIDNAFSDRFSSKSVVNSVAKRDFSSSV
jgi:hypothetical protein